MPAQNPDLPMTTAAISNAPQFWVGVDGGGTNCRAALADATGEVLGTGQAAAANLIRVGLDAAVAHIQQAVHEACTQAGINLIQISGACFGLAGVGNPQHHTMMAAALRVAFPQMHLLLETDARIALAGATDLQPGVVVIAGTGSIACGINARGQFARAGGWGPAMGDEGSGYYIGRRALAAVVMAYDERGAATSLTGPICQHFNVVTPPELPPVIYNEPIKVMHEIAQLSKLVVTHAQTGDAVALGILTDAACELARAVNAVIKKLGMQAETFRVAYVGGVFGAGELVLGPLRQAVLKCAPNAEIAPPLMPPVQGAVKLAMALPTVGLNA
jgi:N-acetylglucosamine kinase-like BadF-type ATPase